MTKLLAGCSDYGKLMLLIGILVAFPLLVIPFYSSERGFFLPFFIPAAFSMLSGLLLCIFGKKEESGCLERQSLLKTSSITVLFTWAWGIFIGAMPFILSGQLVPVQAVFESISGWTTAGLSVMDVQALPKIMLFHRSFMQYCGGLGFVVMMVMLISGRQSMDLFNAEGHPDKLKPNLKKTAQTIFFIYNGFLVAGTFSLFLLGMNFFESLCHAMCALSTGGFSTRANSIGEFGSLPVEMVTVLLMLVGSTNFAVLLLALRGKLRQVIKVSEVRFFAVLLLGLIPVTALSISAGNGLGTGFRHAVFNIVSALSTAGFSTVNLADWPPFALGIMILVMLMGGGIGSTAGGIKLTRIYLMFRIAALNLKKKLLPPRSVDVSYYMKAQGRIKLDEGVVYDAAGFVIFYIGIFIAGSLAMMVTEGCGLTEAMFEFASALGTVGLSIGITGTATRSPTLIVEMIGMILGRLEIFIVLIGFCSSVKVMKERFARG
ncbi:MAG: TrkH family potassium uptake protein [Eubacterium sp.]|nr:TrkH family potassium uptake protein [Eubacterium sp.]